jgi:hypothetical protein
VTPRDVGEVVNWILASFPTQAAKVDSKSMTKAYGAGLMDLDAAQCMAAVTELAKTEDWIPSIAMIRARVVAMNCGERRPGIEAWGDVMREVRRVGRERPPVFADPITAAAVSVLTWSAVCDARAGDAAVRARFCELYDNLAQRAWRNVQISSGATSRALLRSGQAPIGELVAGLITDGKSEEETEDDDGDDE